MKSIFEKRGRYGKWIVGIAAACIVIFLGLQNLSSVARTFSWCMGLISSLILGFAFAIILNVPMSFVESHLWVRSESKVLNRLRRPLAFVISLIAIIGILAGVVWLVIPELIEAIKLIAQSVIDYVGQFSTMSEAELSKLPFGSALLGVDWDRLLEALQNWLKNQSGNIVNTAVGTVSSLVGGVFDFFISLVFAIYILFSKDTLKRQASRLIKVWLPEKFGEWFIHASSVLGKNFKSFISGQSLEAVILGVLCVVGMLIFGFPYAPMVGALVGVTALIPVVGSFIGAGVGAFMILTESPVKAILFLVFIIVLQQLEGNIIYPRVMGSRVNLSGMWILAAVTVGGGIAGPVGMLIAVPLASTVYTLVREATNEREKKLAVNTNTTDKN